MKNSPKYFIHFFFLLSISFNILLSEDCPRDKPIFKSNECKSIYCTPEELSSNECIISNKYIKIQWLNNFHIFQEKNMQHISVTENYKGELFLSSQKISDDYDKYLMAFNKEGEGLFYDKDKDKYNCFRVFDFATGEFSDYNNYIEIDNKGYLIGVPTDDDIYLIDYMNNTIKQFDIRPISKGADIIFQMYNSKNMIFTAYVNCLDSFNSLCYFHFQKYKISPTNLERVQNITEKDALQGSRIFCNQNEKGYIFCFYSKRVGENVTYEYDENEDIDIPIYIPILNTFVSVINPETFEFDDILLIDQSYSLNRIFDETIHLKNDLYIVARSLEENVIKVEFKSVSISEKSNNISIIYNDYFQNIKEIYLNQDKKFDIKSGSFKMNDLYKINDNKFVIFVKEYSKDPMKYTNSILLLYIFTIFNNDQNINVRRYSIDFELYNKKIKDDIRGYSLGNYFGVILGLTQTKDDSISVATFLTFGFVNSTEPESVDTKLKYNNTNSKIVLSKYINEIENNLFGYKFVGVKIISLPSEEDSGLFINSIANEKIKVDDIVSRETELKFILSNSYKKGIYKIQFVGVVEEPSYEEMNELCEELMEYPKNSDIDEKEFYEPKTLMGKKVNFKFRLSDCYDSCDKCSSFSEDENDHKCISCRSGFYFKENTNNCYDKIDTKYYFDKDNEIFRECYKNCLKCSGKENSQNDMNCLSCENDFKFYNRSNNCLNCPKYVNFEQNECINEIPDGYFLEDKDLGSLGKCHYLCKTCYSGPYIDNYNHNHMNCKSCLYSNKKFNPMFEGDCPDSPEIEDSETPVDGKCPIDKPILKDGKCQLIYCTYLEFKNEICKILNPIVQKQWLNNFHIFSELNTSSISLANDIIENKKIILFAQNLQNGYKEKYLYGFYNNGTGIFYNKNKNTFDSFKKMDFPENKKLIDDISYIEMDYEGYLLSTPIENNLYLLDYIDDKISKKEIDAKHYSTFNKIILMEKEDESRIPDYLTCYIYCKDKTKLDDDCYLMMKDYEAEEEELTEKVSMKESIKVNYNSQLKCYKDEHNYIRCTYSKYGDDSKLKHILGMYSSGSLSLKKEFILEDIFDNEPTFDSMIRLKNYICIIAYSSSDNKNVIKILIKKIQIDSSGKDFIMNDYISQIPQILLNEDNLYKFEGAKSSRNSLVKINTEKFALLINNFKDSNSDLNSEIVIFILNIYDSNSKINVRHYTIDFALYNSFVSGKIIGYNLNGFFGALIELTSPGNKELKRASFFTFGYVNSTNDMNPIEGNNILISKKEKIKLINYFGSIENNLFGYDFQKIKVISIPDEKNCGYFRSSINNKLKKGDLLSTNIEIEFVMSETAKTGNYSIVFAPILKEPESYDTMNTYCKKLESYPKSEKDSEKNDYKPQEILGKYFSFNFYINNGLLCYQNCETCYEESKNMFNQQCIKCKENYYKINGTNNCFNKMTDSYFFDKNKELFMPCHKNCLSCNNYGNDTNMNCLSCDDDYDFYKKSSNCLNCPKYVDYSQEKCINEIPDGYYLDSATLGIIEKCYDLCKTCIKKPTFENGILYMNCKTCKYSNRNFISKIEGNCPDTQGEKSTEDQSNKDGDSFVLVLVIISCIIIIFIVVSFILYKRYNNKTKINDNDKDYFKMKEKGKNINLEDEPIN